MFILVAQCTDGTLDIINEVNSDVKDNGQLFICLDDTWFLICSTGFFSEETQAACRQLGFVDGSKLWYYWLCDIIVIKSPGLNNLSVNGANNLWSLHL